MLFGKVHFLKFDTGSLGKIWKAAIQKSLGTTGLR